VTTVAELAIGTAIRPYIRADPGGSERFRTVPHGCAMSSARLNPQTPSETGTLAMDSGKGSSDVWWRIFMAAVGLA
jgi:hypothetical protein